MKPAGSVAPGVLMAAVLGLALTPFALVLAFQSHLYVKLEAAPYLAVHNVIELFCVMVSFSIFGIAWFSFAQSGNRFTLFLGVAFLDVGLFDLVHTLSFPGMPDFLTASSTNKGILFWLAARAVSAAAFLASAFIRPDTAVRWLNRRSLLAGGLLLFATVFVIAIYYPTHVPTMFVMGRGLTQAKVDSELFIVGLFALALLAYWRRMAKTGDRALLIYMSAFVVCIFSELSFVLYQSAYDTYNLLGHVYKLAAFVLVYRGIFLMSVLYPYMQLVDANLRVQEEATERETAEESLRTAHEGLRKLISSANVMIIGLDRHGHVRMLNKAAEAITGYTADDLVGGNWFEKIVPRDRYPDTWQAFHTFQTGLAEMPATFENPILTKSGEERLISWQNSTTIGFPGMELSTISFGLDITERSRAQAALQESERRYRQLLDSATDYIYTVEVVCGEPVAAAHGPGCSTVTGYDPEEYAADPDLARRIVYEPDRTAVTRQIERVLTGRPVEPLEHRVAHKDGSIRWVRHTIVPHFDDQHRLISYDGLVTDITERRQAEEAVVAAKLQLERRVEERTADLERANKELEAFSYSVSHDLRAPLRAIDGFAQMLADQSRDELDEEGLHFLDSIDRNARRMDTLINDILDFSRMSRREIAMTPVDMTALAREVFDEVRSAEPERQITLLLGELPPARADLTLVRQVLTNILSNAVKFSGPRTEAVIQVDGKVENGENVYRITDNGVGFDMADADKLFSVFSRLHQASEFEGTGIGLAIVHRIVTRHGGRVWAESAVGKGTTMSFTLPGDPG